MKAQQRRKWMKLLNMSLKELESDSRLLEWCDALSLLLCQNALQPEGRAIEISKGLDGMMHELAMINDQLTVEPCRLRIISSNFPVNTV